MEPIENRLRKLNINETLSKDGKYGKVASIVNRLEMSKEELAAGVTSSRKFGPGIPPKPLKTTRKTPEIPQSVKQSGEPLYSQRLPSMINSPERRMPILQRKQPIYSGQNVYEKMNAVTLDNPAVLEQQLEALAYHKKQLEKKGLLVPKKKEQIPNISCIPKLSSTSLVRDTKSIDPGPNEMYTNLRSEESINDSNKSKSYISHPSLSHDDNYHNVCDNVAQDNLSQGNIDFSNFVMPINVEDVEGVPPSPSPVSSSYSELRRAHEICSRNCSMAKTEDLQLSPLDQNNGVGRFKPKDARYHQTYMNTGYQNDYTNQSPTLQSISQDSCSDYYGYGSFSQEGSLTYESIYEPINPRPQSQLSSLSQSVNYGTYVNEPQDATGDLDANTSPITSMQSKDIARYSQEQVLSKKVCEPERNSISEFLSGSNYGNDLENYGICVKCDQTVLGENSGCTAMDQIYHIACFTCSQCQINLQGKPFYALDGKPFCEFDYLQTLEKCSVCMKPILERILRATGKPYHPQCFTCIMCGKSLDGIPFTVDATNQNYCIADFHKKFAPRCCVCNAPIMPEPGEEETVRVVALDRSFHFECYKCEDCGLLLSSEAEGRGCYPLDDHVLCKSCNAKRVQMLTNKMTTDL